jgi:heterotetrameric sarcosine oxidase gamma subunit
MKSHPGFTRLTSVLAQSGIESTKFQSETVRIEELGGRHIARLQCLPNAPRPVWSGLELPGAVGACAGAGPVALCLGPREWIIMGDAALPETRTESAAEEDNVFWTDLSAGLAVFRLEGAGAPWLLNKLSCLDFQSCHDAGEHCARTRMGQIAVVIHFHRSPEGGERFDLVVDRSVARYLWELLCASAPHADDLAKSRGEAA